MIEIIREENSGTTERRSLPKDIKQMGKPDIGERIYVENAVYQFLHPYSNIQEKSAYVLLGRFENYSGRDCVFVEAAILLEEIAFEGELPILERRDMGLHIQTTSAGIRQYGDCWLGDGYKGAASEYDIASRTVASESFWRSTSDFIFDG